MKIKKILAGLITCAITLSAAVIPSSAATITLLPTGGSKKYAIELTAETTTAEIKFSAGNSMTLSSSAVTGGTGGILTSDNSTYTVATIDDAKLNNAPITNTSVVFGLQTADNMLPTGTITRYVWTGKLILTDSSKHPVNDLKMNLDNLKYNLKITITYEGQLFDVVFNSAKGQVKEISDTTTFKKDTPIRIRDLVNGGKGFMVNEKESLRNGSNFKATITLKDAVPSGGINYITFYTDLYNTSPVASIANSGAKSVTIDIPKYYIYNEEEALKYGTDLMFENIYLGGASEFTSIVLTYTEGTTPATTTTPAGTIKPADKTVDTPAETNTDSAEDELFLNYNSLTLNKNASVNLKASYDGVKWTTSSRAIVRVFTSGKITAVAPGTATITATGANGDKVRCTVTVIDSSKPITSYALNTTKGTVYVDSAYSISKATVTPSGYTDKITWTSSDTSVATVNTSGKVTIVGVGKVTITATTSSGRTSSCVLTAKNPTLSLASSSASIKVNETVAIKATAKPTSSVVTYESMNEKVATVDKNGLIKGLSKGTAKIEVTSSKGGIKIFTVTVN